MPYRCWSKCSHENRETQTHNTGTTPSQLLNSSSHAPSNRLCLFWGRYSFVLLCCSYFPRQFDFFVVRGHPNTPAWLRCCSIHARHSGTHCLNRYCGRSIRRFLVRPLIDPNSEKAPRRTDPSWLYTSIVISVAGAPHEQTFGGEIIPESVLTNPTSLGLALAVPPSAAPSDDHPGFA